MNTHLKTIRVFGIIAIVILGCIYALEVVAITFSIIGIIGIYLAIYNSIKDPEIWD